MRVSRAEILRLIPHAGSMCLQDVVLEYDDSRILCQSDGHRATDHPLRREGQLSALHLAEYGAQAMAVHGGLLARQRGEKAAPGFLAAVRDLRLQTSRLDDLQDSLLTEAKVLLAGPGGWTYEFQTRAGGRELASGRVMVMLADMGHRAAVG